MNNFIYWFTYVFLFFLISSTPTFIFSWCSILFCSYFIGIIMLLFFHQFFYILNLHHAFILLALTRAKSRHMLNEARIAIYQYIDRYTFTNWCYWFILIYVCFCFGLTGGGVISFPYRQDAQVWKGQTAKSFYWTPMLAMAWSGWKAYVHTCSASGEFLQFDIPWLFQTYISWWSHEHLGQDHLTKNKIHLMYIPLKMDSVYYLWLPLIIDSLHIKLNFIPL